MRVLLLFIIVISLYSKESIDVNFKDLSIDELIKITSKVIGKNILVTKKVDGFVDFISNGPITKQELLEILKTTLQSNGYTLIEDQNIYKVVKDINFTKRVVNRKSTKDLKQKCISKIVFLSNIDAKSVEGIIKEIVSQKSYKEGEKLAVAVDEVLNSVILNGTEEEVQSFINLINSLDIQKEQVYVKAKIIELDDNLVKEVGLQYGILGGNSYSGGLYTFATTLNSGKAIAIDTNSIGLDIPNVTSTIALGATLNLLNRTYALDIISEPSILASNNKQSLIYVGETISLQTGTTVTDGGNQTITYEREDIGLSLKVRPRVFKEKKVLLQIDTLVEDIKNRVSINSNPDTSKKQIITEALLNNGESVIIGGLTEKRNEKSEQKVPYISAVPLIGELFKNSATTLNSKNLLVIITPYIVPKNKDLTYVREELAKLKNIEDKFLEDVLNNLRDKRTLNSKSSKLSNKELHQERIKEYFGI